MLIVACLRGSLPQTFCPYTYASMKALASTIKMRSLTYAIIGSLLLVVVQSQVNNCGQLCINNLLAKAPALGCSSNDAACVCKNVDFGYGLRDCAIQACGAAQEAAVLAYGTSYCQCTYTNILCRDVTPSPC